MAKRRYEQRLRAETAEETRRRILDAVYERLREAPSQPVSVDRIARMAGVARSTVYLVFGSRAGLFDALGDDLLRRDAYGRLLDAVADPDAAHRAHEHVPHFDQRRLAVTWADGPVAVARSRLLSWTC